MDRMGTGWPLLGSTMMEPISMGTGRPVTGSVWIPPTGNTVPVAGCTVTPKMGTWRPQVGSGIGEPYLRSLFSSRGWSLVLTGSPVTRLIGYGMYGMYGSSDLAVSPRNRNKEGNVLFNDALNTFYLRLYGRKEGNILFNDALNTFYLRLYRYGWLGMECMGCVGLQISPSHLGTETRKEGNVLFNNALNTFYLRLYGYGLLGMEYMGCMGLQISPSHLGTETRKEGNVLLTMHSTHFIYGYMVIWLWLIGYGMYGSSDLAVSPRYRNKEGKKCFI